ncbi:Uncharacterized protein dnm_002670 [Desulfonema magnum]|uniref:Uncharacterized protein n=1 Tax=Desulfonema magnum TaxID=45655 RepID=A0A975BFD8_9BACT|nr:Uncharacterized protein dnm_002670 [Desulfonema magnum]
MISLQHLNFIMRRTYSPNLNTSSADRKHLVKALKGHVYKI